MNKYKVSFWFGSYIVNPFTNPSRVVEVESETELTDNEATVKALEVVGTYPRTYSASVSKAD
jgi:hypothetical protein